MGTQLSRLEHLPDAKPKPSHAELRATLPKLSIPSEFLIREDRDAR